jgi:hypothetical protein
MAEMQRIIDAENSDLFDVLAHVAYALPPLTRQERAEKAKVEISTHFNSKQQIFLDFVLSQRESRRGGTRAGQALAVAEAQIPQCHRRRRGRLGKTRRDWKSLRGIPEVSVSTATS